MQVPRLLPKSGAFGPQPHSFAASANYSAEYRQPANSARQFAQGYGMLKQEADGAMDGVYQSTEVPKPKHVSFVLVLSQPQQRARLPLGVDIHPHDTTESIVTTARNFFGLYERNGIAFQDGNGNTLIARYENFTHGMTVYVRVTAEDLDMDEHGPATHSSRSPRRARLEDGYPMLPPTLGHRQASRSNSRNGPPPSHSPQPGHGRRSASANANSRSRTRPVIRSRGPSSHGSFADALGDANCSDSDGGGASVTSSRRGKKEQVASAEISVENIVQGGRRKRQKFDSSELPLFIPPQVPETASLSSVSPHRRIGSHNGASPYSYNTQQTFAFSHPMQSPQSLGRGDASYFQGLATPYGTSSGNQGYRSRARGSAQYVPSWQSGNGGAILPTPDPTLSVISDEDVARQLMRLGDVSNISTHGRTSTSTLDDSLSRHAHLSSASDESDEGSDDGHDLPPLPYNMGHMESTNGQHSRAFESGESSGEDYDDNQDDSFQGESDGVGPDARQENQVHSGAVKGRTSLSTKIDKMGKARSLSKGKGKPSGTAKQPISPTSLPPQSRKTSSASLNFQHPLGVDEEDLSTKPRCQRCRKSKKGCDRQRPCQRCKDAGIGIDGCVSEDEGNGRKGRYGRHMGVAVKKQEMGPPAAQHSVGITAQNYVAIAASDKNKKRKR